MKYLTEHADEILLAIRDSKDLLCRGGTWETTAWARTMHDAVRLAETLRDGVFAAADLIEGCTDAHVGLVRRIGRGNGPIRWGVIVRLARA